MIFREKAKKQNGGEPSLIKTGCVCCVCIFEKKSVYQIDFSLCAAYINEEFVTFHLRSLTSSRDFFHLISYLIEIRIKQSFLYTVGGFSFFDACCLHFSQMQQYFVFSENLFICDSVESFILQNLSSCFTEQFFAL